jgi:hypothetical protein
LAKALFATLALVLAPAGAHAPSDSRPIRVAPDRFVRAESDLYFSSLVKDGRLGTFSRHPSPGRHPSPSRRSSE